MLYDNNNNNNIELNTVTVRFVVIFTSLLLNREQTYTTTPANTLQMYE